MANSKDLTVIIPIHKYNETVEELLKKAIQSVNKELSNIIFVGPNDVLQQASKLCKEATLVKNEDTDVYTQINKGVLKCVTQYFTVLEFDDVLLPNFYTHLLKEVRGKTVTLPLNEYIENGEFKAFGNEIAWDAAFIHDDEIGPDGNVVDHGEIGYVTEKELRIYNDFNVTGAVIKTEDFISLGYLKPEFKITAWYEFLMRVAKAGKLIYVFPRVCYSHTVLREDSYMVHARENNNGEEVANFMKEILGPEE